MNRWTQLVHFNPNPGDPHCPNTTPIYQTATFAQSSASEFGQYDYTRSGNPTRTVLESQIAQLESAQHGFVFASGMAALNAIIGLLDSDDHIIASDDLYGGTYRMLSKRLVSRQLNYTLVDTSDLKAIKSNLTTRTKLILIETPSNPTQKISDIEAISKLAHQYGIIFVVDNTFLSPWLQQPLLLGADLVVHSATKHLSGHSDVTAGSIATNNDTLAEKIKFIQNADGTALSPFESWLLIRGIKTLGLRIERQQHNAEKIVAYLKNNSKVKQVFYAGLPEHPNFSIHQQQAKGGGSVIGFTTGCSKLSNHLVEKTKLFTISVSFGSVSSLISLPSSMSHASIQKEAQPFESNLIRLSIGIESVDDLIDDLENAFSTFLI